MQARDLGLLLHSSFRDQVLTYFIVFLSCFLSVSTSKYLSISSNFLYSCQPHCSLSNCRLSWATSVFPACSSPPCIHSYFSPFYSPHCCQTVYKKYNLIVHLSSSTTPLRYREDEIQNHQHGPYTLQEPSPPPCASVLSAITSHSTLAVIFFDSTSLCSFLPQRP